MRKSSITLASVAVAVALALSAAANAAQSGSHGSAGLRSSGATGSAGIGTAPAGGGNPSGAIGSSSAGTGSAAIGNAAAGGGSPSSAIGNAGAGGGNSGNTVTTNPTTPSGVAGTSIGTDNSAANAAVQPGFNRGPAYGVPQPANVPEARRDPTLPEDSDDNAKARADAPPSARP